MAGGSSSLGNSNLYETENDQNNDEGTKSSFVDAREFPGSKLPISSTCSLGLETKSTQTLSLIHNSEDCLVSVSSQRQNIESVSSWTQKIETVLSWSHLVG